MNPQQNMNERKNNQGNMAPGSGAMAGNSSAQNNTNGANFPYGSPNIAFENYNENATKPAQEACKREKFAPINVINANGVVSGQKVVDESWRKIGICAGVLAVGCLIGVICAAFMAHNAMSEVATVGKELETKTNNLDMIYATLGVADAGTALEIINSPDALSGTDIAKIDELLKAKFGAEYKLDFSNSALNYVLQNGAHKLVSLSLKKAETPERVVFYAKNVDNLWKMIYFDSSLEKPCEGLTDEDITVMNTVGLCRKGRKTLKEGKEDSGVIITPQGADAGESEDGVMQKDAAKKAAAKPEAKADSEKK